MNARRCCDDDYDDDGRLHCQAYPVGTPLLESRHLKGCKDENAGGAIFARRKNPP